MGGFDPDALFIGSEAGIRASMMDILVLLDGLGWLLCVLGVVGAVSLFFFPAGRRLQERTLGVLFTVMGIGGMALMWHAAEVGHAARDLTPAQQVELAKAASRFPNAKFEVLVSKDGRESHALAAKIVAAVKAGSGATPLFDEEQHSLPAGVVLVFGPGAGDLRHAVTDAIGRVFIGARIGVISDEAPELDARTVRIVVGEKP